MTKLSINHETYHFNNFISRNEKKKKKNLETKVLAITIRT